ncbi:MAG: hypothetical protein U0531_04935 [Dehalococcoidia bacterium]
MHERRRRGRPTRPEQGFSDLAAAERRAARRRAAHTARALQEEAAPAGAGGR